MENAIFAILAIPLASLLLIGCVEGPETPPEPSPPTPEPPAEPVESCAELGGYECGLAEECSGEWLEAADSFSCCSVECTLDEYAIDPFESTPEDEDLGDLT